MHKGHVSKMLCLFNTEGDFPSSNKRNAGGVGGAEAMTVLLSQWHEDIGNAGTDEFGT